jgi:formamidopyrimidine-DNA glycosylase
MSYKDSVFSDNKMPEGPEIKIFANRLKFSYATHWLHSITIVRGPYKENEKERYKHFRNQVENFQPHTIRSVKTKGKWLYFKLNGPDYAALGVHHGMEGSWCTNPDNKHVILELEIGPQKQKSNKIYFQDSRRMGTFLLLTKEELRKKLDKIGPDIFKMSLEEFNKSLEIKRIQKHRLCEALMDQSVISGIGNYLRADIMYLARIDPKTEIKNLTDRDRKRLYKAIRKVSRSSYKAGSTTVGYYESAIHNGGYQFLVYQKAICPKGKDVQTFKDKNGRTVYYVPRC